jgi:co-chaperonin GroES (HSP10)
VATTTRKTAEPTVIDEMQPISVLFDRVLVQMGQSDGERRSRFEVELHGEEYVILRERDIHAIASKRNDSGTGLYL